MPTPTRSANRLAADSAAALHDADAEQGDHPDDWHEDRLSLAIRVIEALGLRPVVTAAAVLH